MRSVTYNGGASAISDTVRQHVRDSIAHLRVAGDPLRVAEDYEVPLEAVEAALAYYELHRYLIDARIALNDAALSV